MGVGVHAITTNIIPQWDQEILFEILDNIHDVVLVIDSDTTVIYANQAYAKILGVPVDSVYDDHLSVQNKPYLVKEIVASVEKELILSALATYNNNRTNAMKALGFSRKVFYDKLRQYGIE